MSSAVSLWGRAAASARRLPKDGDRPPKATTQWREVASDVLVRKHATRVISEETRHDIDPEGLSFYNVNAPGDYQRALQRWEARLMSSQTFSAKRIVSTAISLSPGA